MEVVYVFAQLLKRAAGTGISGALLLLLLLAPLY
jgi:hypothetical protein